MPVIPQQLASPGSTAAVLKMLISIGLTEENIATVAGVNPRSVRRWLGGAAMRPRYEERIDDLRTVVSELADALPEEVIVNWLRGRNRVLGLRRPLDVLREGEFEEVIDAVNAMRYGDQI